MPLQPDAKISTVVQSAAQELRTKLANDVRYETVALSYSARNKKASGYRIVPIEVDLYRSIRSRTFDMIIRCKTCLLRPLILGDAPSLARHANDRSIWLNLRDRFPHPYSEKDAVEWIQMVSMEPVTMSFGIIVDGEAVGGISLMPHSDIERITAEIGYWLGRAAWGRGIATEAVIAVTQYAFEQLNLTRVFAVPFRSNVGSIRVLQKAGYQFEGCMRHSAIKDGVVIDQLLYAILRNA